jgi:DNA-binding NtrC family response regulator
VRLGETVPRTVDVRIISATNKDLKEQMAKGLFRQDLYYRLSALSYYLTPLRERKEDVPLLLSHFLEESRKRVSPEVMRALMAYDWPGNVRELENEVKKLVLLAGEHEEINLELLSGKISSPFVTLGAVAVPIPQGNGNGHGNGVTDADVSFGETYSLYDYLAFWEKKFIVKALREQRGIKKHAAATLNIPESTLRLKIKQYNIDLDRLEAIS